METTNIKAPEPVNPDSMHDQFQALFDVIKILRQECPWDKKQTNQSISQLLIEETYEMIDAINNNDDLEFSKELGDILLHVIMHSIMAEERNAFNINDVMTRIRQKLVFRHPHVFSDTSVDNESDVMRNWENLKLKEGRTSILQGVPSILPALLRAQRMQFKAAKVGFDWPDISGAWDKVTEEINEFKQEIDNNNPEKAALELGDILFALVNIARKKDIEAEKMLQVTNDKFAQRFRFIEEKARQQDKLLSDMSLEEMDKYWDEAKANGL